MPPDQFTLSRRDFLAFSAASAVLALTACGKGGTPKVGLALGGGGAKGLAHILILETLDEMGIVPHAITGCSIGAIIGALYAAGLSGRDIRAQIEQFFVDQSDAERSMFALPKSIRWLDFIDPALAGGGLLSSDDFIEYLGEVMPPRIPRAEDSVQGGDCRTDDRTGSVIDSGALLPAIQASMAVPGVFPPVKIGDHLLVDGGVANPLPFDLLETNNDIVIAVDVSGNREIENGDKLSSMGVLLQSFHTMSNNLLAEKLKQRRPDIYVHPDISNVKVLEFYKAREVFAQAEPAQQGFAKDLKRALRRYSGQPGCSLVAGS